MNRLLLSFTVSIVAILLLGLFWAYVKEAFERKHSVYRTFGRPSDSPAAYPRVLDSLRSFPLLLPVSIALTVFTLGTRIIAETYAICAASLCVVLYFLFCLFLEYHRLYRSAYKSYYSGIPSERVLVFMSPAIIVLVSILSGVTALPEGPLQSRVTLLYTATFTTGLYSLFYLLLLIVPMERDVALLRHHLGNHALFGEGLPFVDDLCHPGLANKEALTNISHKVCDEFASVLPGKRHVARRLVEYAIALSVRYKSFQEQVTLDRCRTAAFRRKRVTCRFNGVRVSLDIATVRGSEICCNMIETQAESQLTPEDAPIPISLCIEVTKISDVRETDIGSQLPFEPGSSEAEDFRIQAIRNRRKSYE